jgi:Tripartite tricarboxylate transporter TctB family
MRFRFHWNQDSVAGLMFIAWGVAALWIARDYPVGTALRMGPGYFPAMLSWCLIVFGAGIALKGAAVEGEGLERWYFKPLAAVCFSFLAFALLIERAGLPAATIVSMVVGAMGGPEFRWREQIILSVLFAVASVGVFIYALGLPMDIWPHF